VKTVVAGSLRRFYKSGFCGNFCVFKVSVLGFHPGFSCGPGFAFPSFLLASVVLLPRFLSKSLKCYLPLNCCFYFVVFFVFLFSFRFSTLRHFQHFRRGGRAA